MLPANHPDRMEVIGKHLQAVRNGGGFAGGTADWPDYREATERWIDEMIAANHPRISIIRILNLMAAEEKAYRARQEKRTPPTEMGTVP